MNSVQLLGNLARDPEIRFTKTGRFNGIFRRQTVPQNIAPESQIQPERNCMLQELFIDIFL